MNYRMTACAMALMATTSAHAAAAETYPLTLQHHAFNPTSITVPADKNIVLLVKNMDAAPAEFESHDLKIEKIIPGNTEAKIKLRALKPGTYHFMDEFHEKTAKGTLVAE